MEVWKKYELWRGFLFKFFYFGCYNFKWNCFIDFIYLDINLREYLGNWKGGLTLNFVRIVKYLVESDIFYYGIRIIYILFRKLYEIIFLKSIYVVGVMILILWKIIMKRWKFLVYYGISFIGIFFLCC